MTNPEQPVTGTLATFRADELGPDQHGRRVAFPGDGSTIHGLLASTAAGLGSDTITIVLDTPRRLRRVPADTEVTVVVETAAEAFARRAGGEN